MPRNVEWGGNWEKHLHGGYGERRGTEVKRIQRRAEVEACATAKAAERRRRRKLEGFNAGEDKGIRGLADGIGEVSHVHKLDPEQPGDFANGSGFAGAIGTEANEPE